MDYTAFFGVKKRLSRFAIQDIGMVSALGTFTLHMRKLKRI
jgi:hypothetical protein